MASLKCRTKRSLSFDGYKTFVNLFVLIVEKINIWRWIEWAIIACADCTSGLHGCVPDPWGEYETDSLQPNFRLPLQRTLVTARKARVPRIFSYTAVVSAFM